MSPDGPVCPQCGAIGCRGKYEEMLALEFEQPAVFGAVHHITVTCYNLQHPCFFSDEALAWMKSVLRAIVEEGLWPQELRKRSGKTFDGSVNVRRRTAPMVPQGTAWTMTVTDVHTESPDIYIKDIKAWAASVLKDIGAK